MNTFSLLKTKCVHVACYRDQEMRHQKRDLQHLRGDAVFAGFVIHTISTNINDWSALGPERL